MKQHLRMPRPVCQGSAVCHFLLLSSLHPHVFALANEYSYIYCFCAYRIRRFPSAPYLVRILISTLCAAQDATQGSIWYDSEDVFYTYGEHILTAQELPRATFPIHGIEKNEESGIHRSGCAGSFAEIPRR